MKKKLLCGLLSLAVLAGLLSGCAAGTTPADENIVDLGGLMDEAVPLAGAPAVSTLLAPVASGASTAKNSSATIDYSNAKDGYVMVNWTAGSAKLKVQVKGPSGTTYTYNLRSDGQYDTFPLSDGSGSYSVNVFKNISGTQYSGVLAANISAQLTDEFAPFIRPNQYVNYENASKTIAKAAELTGGKSKPLDKVGAVYNYVVNSLTYDRAKAASVTSGYLPDLDSVLASRTGICFDYAALMTGMLRSQGIPCKLVVGYAGTAYHAWVSVWTQETGWVEGAIYFDGTTWHRMDPTFASSGNSSDSIMQYIGNGSNYKVKYLY